MNNIKELNIPGVIRTLNTKIYGITESIIASGYPMQETSVLDMSTMTVTDADLKRAKHLGKALPGSGHDCFTKGIILQFDLQAPEYLWRQFDRYHFRDYVSSQSKMHRILKFDIDLICNKYVSAKSIEQLNEFIDLYNNYEENDSENNLKKLKLRNGEVIEFTKENIFKIIVANIPTGLMLTARISTNYLQLKSIINQRELHKLQEWRYLVSYFRSLPMVEELVIRGE